MDDLFTKAIEAERRVRDREYGLPENEPIPTRYNRNGTLDILGSGITGTTAIPASTAPVVGQLPDGSEVRESPEGLSQNYGDNTPTVEYLKYKWNQGTSAVKRGTYGFEAMRGRLTLQAARERADWEAQAVARDSGIQKDVAFSEEPFDWIIGEAAQTLPFMLSSFKNAASWDAASTGLAWAARGFFMGGGPASSAAAGAGAALTYSAVKTSMVTEGGNLYLDMVKQGYPEDTAKVAALAGGAVIGSLEAVQFRTLTGGAKKAFKAILGSEMAKKTLAHWATQYAKEVGIEASTEAVQEAVGLAAQSIAAMYENRPDLQPESKDWYEQTSSAFVKSLAASSVLQGVSRAAGTVTGAGARLVSAKAEEGRAARKEARTDTAIVQLPAMDTPAKAAEVGTTAADNPALLAEIEDRRDLSKALAEEGKRQRDAGTLSPESAVALQQLEDTVLNLEIAHEAAVKKLGTEVQTNLVVRPVTQALKEEIVSAGAKLDQLGEEATDAQRKEVYKNLFDLAKVQDAPTIEVLEGEKRVRVPLSGDKLVRIERGAMAALREAASGSYKRGTQNAMKAAKAAVQIFKTVVRESGLEPADRAAMLSFMDRVVGEDKNGNPKLLVAMPELLARMRELQVKREERNARLLADYAEQQEKEAAKKEEQKAKAQVEKATKATKGVRPGAASRVPGDVAVTVAAVRRILKGTRDQAYGKLDDLYRKYEITPEDPETNLMYRAAVIKTGTASVQELADFARDLGGYITEGRLKWSEQVQARNEARAKTAAEVLNVVLAGLPEEARAAVASGDMTRVRAAMPKTGVLGRTILTLGKTSASTLQELMEQMSFFAKDTPVGASALEKLGDTTDVANRYDASMQRVTGEVRTLLSILDEEGKGAERVVMELSADREKVKWGGIEREVSTMQKIYLHMVAQNPAMRETLEKMGIDAAAQAEIAASLTDAQLQFADALFEFYRQYYQRVNAVYRRIHFTDMPYEDLYVGIRRVKEASADSAGLDSTGMAFSTAPQSVKGRVASTAPIEVQNVVENLMRHVNEMEYYMAWEEWLRNINSVIGREDVRNAIRGAWGQDVMEAIRRHINDIASKGKSMDSAWRLLDRVMNNIGVAGLALRLYQGFVQVPAILSFASEIPTADFAKGLAYVAGNWTEATKPFRESPFMFSRGKKIILEFEEMARKPEVRNFLQSRSFHDYLLASLTLGDKFTIVAGGSAMYHALRAQGVSHEVALARAVKLADRSQQSGRITQQSILQRQKGIARFLTMYSSYNMQQVRLAGEALRGALSGRMPLDRAAKQFVIHWILIPSITQYLTTMLLTMGTEPDKEDQLRAALLGPANTLPLIGDILSTVVDYVTNSVAEQAGWEPDREPATVFRGSAAARVFEEALKGFKTLRAEDPETEDLIMAWLRIASVPTSLGAGVNLTTAAGAPVNVVQYWKDAEYRKAMSAGLGYSKGSIERAAARKEANQ